MTEYIESLKGIRPLEIFVHVTIHYPDHTCQEFGCK